MADCDASVVVSQSAVLFGLMAIAAVGFGLGWKGFSFGLLCSFCLLTDWTAFSPERGSTLSCSAMGRKTEGGAMGNAVRCVGRCSALRRHLQRTAAFDRECSLVAGIAEGGGVHPPASQARGASLLVAQRCRHPGFCPLGISVWAAPASFAMPCADCRGGPAGCCRCSWDARKRKHDIRLGALPCFS